MPVDSVDPLRGGNPGGPPPHNAQPADSDERETQSSLPGVDIAICVGDEAATRLGPVIRHLCVGLVDLNAKLRIITASPQAAVLGEIGPVKVVRYAEPAWPRPPAWAPPWTNRLLNWRTATKDVFEQLRGAPPALVYAMAADSYDIAERIAREFDAELVLHVSTRADADALDLLLPRAAAHRSIVGERLAGAHVVVASEPLLNTVQERHGSVARAVRLVKPGVLRGAELTCFRGGPAEASIVCTANLSRQSGIEVIIDAIKRVHHRGHRLLAFFLGAGRYEQALRRNVRAWGLSSIVTFACPDAEFLEILRGADIFVIAPGQEPISAAALQALASGTAVVCFQGGVADFLHHGKTAQVCSGHSAEALAQAIEALLEDHGYARALAAGARDYMRAHHPMSAMAEQTMQVFHNALLRRKTFVLNK